MLQKDVSVGAVLWTKVGEERVQVEVLNERDGRPKRYLLRRVDNGRVLPKARTAAALHPNLKPVWPSAMEKQERTAADLSAADWHANAIAWRRSGHLHRANRCAERAYQIEAYGELPKFRGTI
jgi:hypothetical protein